MYGNTTRAAYYCAVRYITRDTLRVSVTLFRNNCPAFKKRGNSAKKRGHVYAIPLTRTSNNANAPISYSPGGLII